MVRNIEYISPLFFQFLVEILFPADFSKVLRFLRARSKGSLAILHPEKARAMTITDDDSSTVLPPTNQPTNQPSVTNLS